MISLVDISYEDDPPHPLGTNEIRIKFGDLVIAQKFPIWEQDAAHNQAMEKMIEMNLQKIAFEAIKSSLLAEVENAPRLAHLKDPAKAALGRLMMKWEEKKNSEETSEEGDFPWD
jgi:hypothetical protein